MHPSRFPLLLCVALLAGCIGGSGKMRESGPLVLTSPAFADGQSLPLRYTCEGEGIAPSLHIEGIPEGTRTLALVLDDLSAPSGHFVHWILWDLPLTAGDIPEGELPPGTVVGTTSAKAVGYFPACPPPGSGLHRYVFTLYAVGDVIKLSYEATRASLEQRMKGKVLQIAKLTATYERVSEGSIE